MPRPRLLDLFCGAGGAAMGYYRAGFDVVGVDIAPQKRYPFEFHQADALTYPLDEFDVIHASPPCQDYSTSKNIVGIRYDYPRLIEPIRQRLYASGMPWVIENVRGALDDMQNPLTLCGTSFALRVQRHRLFECSHLIFGAGPCHHRTRDVCVFGAGAGYIGTRGTAYTTRNGRTQYRRQNCRIAEAREAMGIDWMTFAELSESIPPAYTEWIGRQLLGAVEYAKAG